MPIDGRELIEAISVLADEQNVRVTVKQSGKGAVICGACCFAGGLLMGPPGLAIGGAAGGVVAYKMTQGSFRPLGDVIINDLTDSQKEQLVQHVTKAVQDAHPTDLVMLLPLIMNNVSIQQAVLKTVISFVSSELRMQIID
ncbi:protein Nazo isoform 1-T2 [Cochliomyia hominivorax]